MTEVADVYSTYRITDKISDEERIRSKGLGFWSGLGDVAPEVIRILEPRRLGKVC
jgi:hypothetical protein